MGNLLLLGAFICAMGVVWCVLCVGWISYE